MAGAPLVAAMSPYTAPVHINVGGTTYTSCLETLTKFPHSKLAKLFNGTLPVAVDPVKQRYFLDRDGKMFRHILNFLRNSEMVLPDTFSEFDLLKKEAGYFEIEDLLKSLDGNHQLHCGRQINSDGQTEPGEDNCRDKQQQGEKKKKKVTMKEKQVGNTLQVVNEENEPTARETNVDNLKEKQTNAISEIVNAAVKSTGEQETNDVEGTGLCTSIGVNDVLQVSSSLNKLSGNTELVCVITDQAGKVLELWCSDEKFNIELEGIAQGLIVTKTNLYQDDFLGSCCITFTNTNNCCKCSKPGNWAYVTKEGNHGCTKCDVELKNKGNYSYEWKNPSAHRDDYVYSLNTEKALGFPWIATYLFKHGFRLSTNLLKSLEGNRQLQDCDRQMNSDGQSESGADDCSEKGKKDKVIMKEKQVPNTPKNVNEENEPTTQETNVDNLKEKQTNEVSEIVNAAVESTGEQETNNIEGTDLSTRIGVNDVLQVNSSLNKLSEDTEMVCVIIDHAGKVQELWCSDEEFNIELEGLARATLTVTKTSNEGDFMGSCRVRITTSSKCRNCQGNDGTYAYVTKEGNHGCSGFYCGGMSEYWRKQKEPGIYVYKLGGSSALGFPWIATYLFKHGFRLSTSVSVSYSSGTGYYNHLFLK